MTISADEFFGGSRVRSSATTILLTTADRRLQSVTMTATSQSVRLPAVKAFGRSLARKGRLWVIENAGSNSFTVTDASGNAVDGGTTVAAAKAAFCYVIDNDTSDGDWRVVLLDVADASVTAVPVFGHFFFGNSDSDSVWKYDQEVSEWEQINDCPRITATAVTGNVSFAASLTDAWAYSNDELGAEQTEEYDASTDTWTALSNDPGTSSEFGGFVYESTGAFAWGFGIEDGAGPAQQNEVYELDTSAETWTQKADMAGANDVANVSWYTEDENNENAYVFTSEVAAKSIIYDFSAEVEAATANSNRVARNRFGGFRVPNSDTYIDCMGWIQNSPLTTSAEVHDYDETADEWTQLGDVQFDPVYWFSTYGAGDFGYVQGGINDSGSDTVKTYQYDPSGDEWFEEADHAGGAGSSGRSRWGLGLG